MQTCKPRQATFSKASCNFKMFGWLLAASKKRYVRGLQCQFCCGARRRKKQKHRQTSLCLATSMASFQHAIPRPGLVDGNLILPRCTADLEPELRALPHLNRQETSGLKTSQALTPHQAPQLLDAFHRKHLIVVPAFGLPRAD